MPTTLSPAQQKAFESATRALETTCVLAVSAVPGCGRTTVLRALHEARGGAWVGARDMLDESRGAHPLALEDTLHAVLVRALANADTVIVDDLHLIAAATAFHQMYPRGLMHAVLESIAGLAHASGKRIVFGGERQTRLMLFGRCDSAVVPEFTAPDVAHICRAYLPATTADGLDFVRIHRFAPKLTATQLRRACDALVATGAPITYETFTAHVAEFHLASNVRLGEVQDVDLRDLRGMDDVLEALEAGIVFPLEHAELAESLKLRPKRGVLIAGPPGTGKTTVGRALARRLGGKFFLLDGTVISGQREFYERVQRLFALARQNAPGIIFIDDSDVIFEASNETGFYRYLLTMLDGLESESPGQVCVMMTAMDVGNLPPALVRSGRIELWLETRLPDAAARALILADRKEDFPSAMGAFDVAHVAGASEGLSGADLRRMVEDAKLLYAYDAGRKLPTRTLTEYLMSAMETVRANKERYAQAEARARHPARPVRPVQFHVPMSGGAG